MLTSLRRRLAVAPAGTATSASVPTSAPRALTRFSPRVRPELAGLLVLAALLNLWALSRNGWANEYYSAAVRSMTTSWHNFLFGAFDQAGVMTVDKPPLALWVQAASAKAFGFSSLSMLVPQALMGVAAVALTYDLTRRVFGRPAGFVAGLVLALTPISVAISRHNNPDALLVLCCVAALWCVVRGLADGRTRWMVLAGVAIGLGLRDEDGRGADRRAGAGRGVAVGRAGRRLHPRAAAAGRRAGDGRSSASRGRCWWADAGELAAVGLRHERQLDLVADRQLQRRRARDRPGRRPRRRRRRAGRRWRRRRVRRRRPASSGCSTRRLGAQAGWLLGFALVSGVAVAIGSRLRRGDARTGWLVATGGAFLGCAVTFSAASGIFHPYYVSLLAPFTAALVGGGVGQFLRAERSTLWLAPAAVVLGGFVELVVINNTSGAPAWAKTVIIVTGIVSVAAMVAAASPRVRMVALGVALAGLLAAPGELVRPDARPRHQRDLPRRRPGERRVRRRARRRGMGGPPGGGNGTLRPAERRRRRPSRRRHPAPRRRRHVRRQLRLAHRPPSPTSRPTAAAPSASPASRARPSAIIESGADVAGLGGFSGRESEVTVAWLKQAVAEGKIRWVLVDGNTRHGPAGRPHRRHRRSWTGSRATASR